jgi:transposase
VPNPDVENLAELNAQVKAVCKLYEEAPQRIHFVYTPKHCSWLNQVECWFSILARRLLQRSSFLSVEHLSRKIIAFINYFNELLSKPFKWKFRG